MGIVRAIKRFLGMVFVAIAALLGLLAISLYFDSNSTGSRSLAVFVGCLSMLLLFIGLRGIRGNNKTGKRIKRSKTGPCTIEGWWCETAIKLAKSVITPLGGKVTSIVACVDIRYEVQNRNILLLNVSLAMPKNGSFNVAAKRRGEAWKVARICSDSELLKMIQIEMREGSRLRKVMLGRWHDTHHDHCTQSIPQIIIGNALPTDNVEHEWEDPALIQNDNAPWRPWMRKGRLYRAIREGRYIHVAYQKKDGEEATVRILYPKKITKGKMRADDLTPGKTPGIKTFIVDRITYVELLPQEWTPMELGQ